MSVIRNIFRERKNIGRKPQVRKPEIIVAPDKFKGTLTAAEVAGTISGALAHSFPGATVHICPMADGGDGTAEVLASFLALEPMTIRAHNALMEECEVIFYASGTTCAVDSASIVGLAMLGERTLTPWQSTTHGIGEFILSMLGLGMERIFIGIGGTATIDCGIGMLGALGARFFNVEGEEITERPLRARHLGHIYSADFSSIDRAALKSSLHALADVDVPLISDSINSLSPSSLSYAVQKGITVEELPLLFSSLKNFREAVDAALLSPAAEPSFQGAGGGLGYAIHRILRCQCSSGAKHLSALYNIDSILSHADCLITGEGCYDAQSTHGKVVGTLTAMAAHAHVPAIIVAGRSSLNLPSSGNNASGTPGTADNPIAPAVPSIITTTQFQEPSSLLEHNTALEALHKTIPHIENAVKSILNQRIAN